MDSNIEIGTVIDIECPHCLAHINVQDKLEFGKIYELSCPECKNKFVLVIPAYTVRKGLIEEVIHGKSRN